MPSTPTLGLPYPTAADTADVPRDIQALALAIDGQPGVTPVGGLLLWATAVPPAGWLTCIGQLVSAAAYPRLATVLGQVGGNVQIPDLRDRVPMGASASKPLGVAGGEAAHTIAIAELPVHHHAAGGLTDPATASGNDTPDHWHAGFGGQSIVQASQGTSAFFNVRGGSTAGYIGPGLQESGTGQFNLAAVTAGANARHTHTTAAHAVTGNTADTGGAAAMPLLPKFLALNYIIRAA